MTRALHATVVYALAQRQWVVPVTLAPGATLRDALEASGLAREHPELAGGQVQLGIYHRRLAPDTPLREGDRVEVYRPLRADPRQMRRERAQARRTTRS